MIFAERILVFFAVETDQGGRKQLIALERDKYLVPKA
jgi:hypothetical protein